MSAPGFYENHEAAKPVIDRHQALMWEVGDLMNQWEALQTESVIHCHICNHRSAGPERSSSKPYGFSTSACTAPGAHALPLALDRLSWGPDRPPPAARRTWRVKAP